MNKLFLFFALIPLMSFAQKKVEPKKTELTDNQYIKSVKSLTLEAAFELSKQASEVALTMDKKVSIAILDASGTIILLVRGDNVGPHNTEASRRKAFTALSTKTASFELMQKAASDSTAKNLNTLPELLLLGGGVPIWKDGEVVGSIGVSGAGGGENDHYVAQKAVEYIGFSIKNK